MGTITHAHQTAIANDPSKDVSADAWNQGHNFSLAKSDVGLGNVDNLSSATILASAATAAAALYRPKLTADTTVNVPSQFATLQAALNFAATIDFNGFTLTIQLADGTYTGQTFVPVMVGQATAASLLIKGNVATPTNCVLTASLNFDGIIVADGLVRCRIQGIGFVGTGAAPIAVKAQGGSVVEILNCDFGTGFFYHRYATGAATILLKGNISISGSVSGAHMTIENNAFQDDTGGLGSAAFYTVTLIGTPDLGFGGYVFANLGGVARSDFVVFNGAATGPRFFVQLNGVINSGGGGATFYPGNGSGTIATGGQYF